jgi:hypothetical protein
MLRGRGEEIQIMILNKYFTHLCHKRAYLYGIPICAFVLDRIFFEHSASVLEF